MDNSPSHTAPNMSPVNASAPGTAVSGVNSLRVFCGRSNSTPTAAVCAMAPELVRRSTTSGSTTMVAVVPARSTVNSMGPLSDEPTSSMTSG